MCCLYREQATAESLWQLHLPVMSRLFNTVTCLGVKNRRKNKYVKLQDGIFEVLSHE